MKTLTEFSTVMLQRGAAARTAKTAEGVAAEGMAEAIAGALTIPAERAQRLLEAIDIVGADLDKVRLVRVFQGEKGPLGATSVGEFHYAMDRVVVGGGRKRDDRGGDRGGRGGDRGGRGGGGGGGGGGGRGGGGPGGFGGERGPAKPRGLSSLMNLAGGDKKDDREDRARPGEIPRAGLGWVLTAAARDPRGERKGPPGRGGPRRDRPGGGPGGDRDRRGPRPGGAPGAPGADGANAGAPGGDDRRPPRGPRGPRPDGPRGPRPDGPRGPRADGPRPDRGPRNPPVNTQAPAAVSAPATPDAAAAASEPAADKT